MSHANISPQIWSKKVHEAIVNPSSEIICQVGFSFAGCDVMCSQELVEIFKVVVVLGLGYSEFLLNLCPREIPLMRGWINEENSALRGEARIRESNIWVQLVVPFKPPEVATRVRIEIKLGGIVPML